ncbi:MAG: right-handed parallel beta-helix repeat-containing protein [Opitutaceae bacterium]|nr:right-handed parallel beta-helix repeat-containing protein [Opitutaceae bacterium]
MRYGGPLILAGALALAVLTSGLRGAPAEIWVAPDGTDTALGSREAPLATVRMALRKAWEMRRLKDPAITEGVRVIVRGGLYRFDEALLVRPEDSGTAKAPTVVEAAPGEEPRFSGGVAVDGWRRLAESVPGLPAAARGHVWGADAPRRGGRVLEFRQLWVGQTKAVRAREPDGDEMIRLLEWDRAREEAWVPADAGAGLRNLDGVEMVVHQQWEIAVLRLKSRDLVDGRARLTFHAPESRIQFEHPWPQPVINKGNPDRTSAFFLAHAIEFLDTPGEWFQDLAGGRVYYWPREGEDLTQTEVTAPALEVLMAVMGTLDRPVEHVTFRGLGFAHSSWLRPSREGHVPHQAGMPMVDAYGLQPRGTPDWRSLDNQAWVERAAAAVRVSGANHIAFEACRFEHTAMSAVDFAGGTRDDRVERCLFRDIGGNGIQMGSYGEGGFEIHLPNDPTDERVVCTRERIADNRFIDTANEDWGCVAISVGTAREVTIEHNDIVSTSYTGISVGWGWTRTPHAAQNHAVRANRIRAFATRMADCAGIYLVAAQPGSVVSGNVIDEPVIGRWVHDPEHWGFVYLDEGSSYTTVRDNWCPREKFIKNANGPGNEWGVNGPAVPEAIRDAAGPRKRTE